MNPRGPDPQDLEGGGSPGPGSETGAPTPNDDAPPDAMASAADQATAGGDPSDAPTAVIETPAPVETDTPVDTEAVEPPPVTIATVDRPPGPRRVGGRVAAIVGIVAILAIGGVVYAGYALNQDLSTTRTTLATTDGKLGSTRTALDETNSKLATTATQLAERTKNREALDAEIEGLSAQVATQTECVRLQEEALLELIRISDLQTANFNRTADESTWARAEDKRGENIDVALDAFYEAYKAAFQGSTGTAKTHANRGQAAQARLADADRQQVAELNLVDQKAAEIQAAIEALEQQLTETQAVCEGVAP